MPATPNSVFHLPNASALPDVKALKKITRTSAIPR